MPRERIDMETAAYIMREHLSSETGQRRLGETMAASLRQMKDYQSIGRRIFLPEDVPCRTCGGVDNEAGCRAGCQECIARSVMET